MVEEQHKFFEHTLELCGAHAELPVRFICNDKQTQRIQTFLGSLVFTLTSFSCVMEARVGGT